MREWARGCVRYVSRKSRSSYFNGEKNTNEIWEGRLQKERRDKKSLSQSQWLRYDFIQIGSFKSTRRLTLDRIPGWFGPCSTPTSRGTVTSEREKKVFFLRAPPFHSTKGLMLIFRDSCRSLSVGGSLTVPQNEQRMGFNIPVGSVLFPFLSPRGLQAHRAYQG